MTIEEMRRRKEELGYTNKMLSEKTGIPLGTIEKVFSGATRNPHWNTRIKLEAVLDGSAETTINYLEDREEESMVMEGVPAYEGDPHQGFYTLKDYYALPDDRRVELIDGFIYDMASPSAVHQLILGQLHLQFNECVERHLECELFLAPCDVRLDRDNRTMVQPDLFIICHDDQITRRRIEGAPDFVIEILSPSTREHDFYRKLYKYKFAGVREYWTVDPQNLKVLVHDLEHSEPPAQYTFSDSVEVIISDGECRIDFEKIYQKIKKYL